MDRASVTGKAGSDVRSERGCEDPARKEKQKRRGGQSRYSLSHALWIAPVDSGGKGVNAAGHRIPERDNDYGNDDAR